MTWIEVIGALCEFYGKLPSEIYAYPDAAELMQVWQARNWTPPKNEQ